MESVEKYELIVIGAGWHGLVSAATYLQLHPNAPMAIIESQSSLGGVWSEERQYPDLRSNNMLGTYEYSDFPMDSETYGIKPGEHIPGQTVHRYLSDYARKSGIYGRIRCDTKITEAERIAGEGWRLRTESKDVFLTKNLIVATGLTSQPSVPSIPGSKVFCESGLLIHSRDFKQHSEQLLDGAKRITVLGGSKSAWDVAYTCATRDCAVDMVIRSSGQGPTWMAPPYVTPFKAWLEKLVHMRFLTWLSPCIWGDEDGYGIVRRLLHNTWLGRKMVDAFWYILSSDAAEGVGYDKHPETAKLKPWNSAFWTGNGLGILNYPSDFLQLVRNDRVRVHVADVTRLEAGTVYLSDGIQIKADAVVCATGWKARPPLRFLPEGVDRSLGLPFNLPTNAASTQEIIKADTEILSRFPRLTDQPPTKIPGGDTSADDVNQPFRLYRFMAPPQDIHNEHNIAFAGMMATITTAICAQVQALWISAYFDGKLSRLPASNEEAQKTALLHSRFGRWRYPCGYGARFPDFVFDALPYLDMLLKDLGLRSHRKAGWMAEIFRSYGPEDYRNLVDEWREKA